MSRGVSGWSSPSSPIPILAPSASAPGWDRMCRRASRRPQWGSQLENPSGKGGEGRGGRGLAPRSRGSQAAALPRSHPRREPRCQRAQPTAGLITGRQSAGPEPSQIPRGAVAGDEVGGAVTGADATAERPWLGDRKSGRWGSLSAVIYGAARAHKRDAAALEMGRAGSELFPLPGVNNAARKPPRLSGV